MVNIIKDIKLIMKNEKGLFINERNFLMNKIEEEQFVILLDMLDKDLINEKDFYKLVKFSKDNLNSLLEIIEIDGIVEKRKLIKQLIECKEVSRLNYLLKKYPIYRSNVKSRDFIFNNIRSPYIMEMVNLLRFEFLICDEVFVRNFKRFLISLNREDHNNLNTNLVFVCFSIEENIINYENGDKNRFLELGFNLKNFHNIRKYMELLNVSEFLNEPKWFNYFIDYLNYDYLYGERIVSNLLSYLDDFRNYNRFFVINEKFLEIENLDEEREKKIVIFSKFVNNLIRMAIFGRTSDDNYFNYLVNFLGDSAKKFNFRCANVDLFCNICDEDVFNALLLSNSKSIRLELIRALKTSLKDYVDVDFIKCASCFDVDTVRYLLKELAILENCLDYLELYVKEKDDFADNLLKFMNEYPNMSKEELLGLKVKKLDNKNSFND